MWYKEQARVRILYPVRLDLSKNYFIFTIRRKK